jgi:hypothetical protein
MNKSPYHILSDLTTAKRGCTRAKATSQPKDVWRCHLIAKRPAYDGRLQANGGTYKPLSVYGD